MAAIFLVTVITVVTAVTVDKLVTVVRVVIISTVVSLLTITFNTRKSYNCVHFFSGVGTIVNKVTKSCEKTRARTALP